MAGAWSAQARRDPMGVHVRIVEAAASDLQYVLEVERLAFGGDDEAELVRDLLGDPTARPLLSLLAWEDDRPVGHILFTAARLQGAPGDVPVSILAPLAVIPDAQRQGVGGALVEEGVRRQSGSGVALVFVLGHPGYYPRHGFEPACMSCSTFASSVRRWASGGPHSAE